MTNAYIRFSTLTNSYPYFENHNIISQMTGVIIVGDLKKDAWRISLMHPDKLLTAAKPAARFDSFFLLNLALIGGRILKSSGSSF